jgi:serine/threonine-protein kinase
MEPLAGTPYRLVRRLGAGAAGEVFEALDQRQGARRALKILSMQNLGRTEVVERMKIEAQTLASLHHKNLVEVVDLGVAGDGRLYFAMELLEGTSLRQTIKANGKLRTDVALELCIELCEGLAAAHAAGVVHRDIKPENIFVCSTGVVKVLDFGTAKVAYASGPQTQAGFTLGTLAYMAPEQIEGKPVDARTDVYAAGLVLFEMLTGKPPFDDKDNVSLAFAHATRPPPTLAERGVIAPPELEHAVARALSKAREDRFGSATDFAAALGAILSTVRMPTSGKGMTVRISTVPSTYVPPDDLPVVVPEPKKRLHPIVLVLVLVLGLVLVVDLVLVILRARK